MSDADIRHNRQQIETGHCIGIVFDNVVETMSEMPFAGAVEDTNTCNSRYDSVQRKIEIQKYIEKEEERSEKRQEEIEQCSCIDDDSWVEKEQ